MMHRELAKIERTFLGVEDHGIFTFSFDVNYDNGLSQGIGNLVLDYPKKKDGKFLKREGTAYGAEMIMRLLEVVGVGSWEKLSGRVIWVLFEKKDQVGWGRSEQPIGIAGTFNNKQLIFEDVKVGFADPEIGGENDDEEGL